MSGWIKLHRDIQDSAIASHPEYLAVWVHLMIRAQYSASECVIGRQVVRLIPGQLVFGRLKFSAETGVSENKVRAALDVMKSLGMITIKSMAKFSIISITNWKKYQEDNQQIAAESPASNQQSTSNQPASDHIQEGKESKEGEEGKEIKNTTPQAAAGLFGNPDDSNTDNKKPPKPKAAEKFNPASLASTMPNELGRWWIMWIEYRRARKLSTKEPTWRLQASNLEEWGKAGLDPCQAIKASIENGWQGLFEPKPKNTGMSNGYQPRPANHIDDNNTDWINGIDPRVFDRARAGGSASQQGSARSEGHMSGLEGCDNQPSGLRLNAPAVAHRDAGKQDFD